MPLHLLGKKSWNVYNKANIERVRRDEAEARKKEEANERRQQEAEAHHRLAILRGEDPLALSLASPDDRRQTAHEREGECENEATAALSRNLGSSFGSQQASRSRGARKLRKRPGEDDTEYELRLAMENTTSGANQSCEAHNAKQNHRQAAAHALSRPAAPITDTAGHIDLFGSSGVGAGPGAGSGFTSGPGSGSAHRATGAQEHRVVRASEDNERGKIVHAHANANANANANAFTEKQPWYMATGLLDTGLDGSFTAPSSVPVPAPGSGHSADPRRQQRVAARLAADDPLAAMKQGAQKVRQLKKERQAYVEAQRAGVRDLERDLRQPARASRDHDDRRRRRREEEEEQDGQRDSKRHRRRSRSRSRSRSRERSRSRNRNRNRNKSGRDRERERERDYDRKSDRRSERRDRRKGRSRSRSRERRERRREGKEEARRDERGRVREQC